MGVYNWFLFRDNVCIHGANNVASVAGHEKR